MCAAAKNPVQQALCHKLVSLTVCSSFKMVLDQADRKNIGWSDWAATQISVWFFSALTYQFMGFHVFAWNQNVSVLKDIATAAGRIWTS